MSARESAAVGGLIGTAAVAGTTLGAGVLEGSAAATAVVAGGPATMAASSVIAGGVVIGAVHGSIMDKKEREHQQEIENLRIWLWWKSDLNWAIGYKKMVPKWLKLVEISVV